GNAYSVHPEAIGRMISVSASLDRVVARCGDRVVADHQRLWGTAGLASDPEHRVIGAQISDLDFDVEMSSHCWAVAEGLPHP
ncbi:Mu transposase domain-containing protein, partial [Mycobacterium avium]